MRVKDANHYLRTVICPDQQRSQREHRALSVSIHANQGVPHVDEVDTLVFEYLERWARTASTHGVAFSTTEGGRSILAEAIERLRSHQPEALRVTWGSPELALFEMAGVRPIDRSN